MIDPENQAAKKKKKIEVIQTTRSFTRKNK